MRCPQPNAAKGSLKWLRVAVEATPQLLEDALPLAPGETMHWLSPTRCDEWAEYRDGAFLDRLGISHCREELAGFWPKGGPQWDGLARTSPGKLILVEAKAHVAEMFSSCSATSHRSKARIRSSLAAAKRHYGAPAHVHWTFPFYQYTNRLAHLHWLRSICGLDAHLLFVYFLHDEGFGHRPATAAEWVAALAVVHESIGLRGKVPEEIVHSAYIDVRYLTQFVDAPIAAAGRHVR
jgi:hypothetical protein